MFGLFNKSVSVPLNSAIVTTSGFVSELWGSFFGIVLDRLGPLGVETSQVIENNKTTAVVIPGLSFNKLQLSYALIEYFIQRVTTSTGATELIEAGTLRLVYKPTSESWSLTVVGTSGPDDAGIDFSITADGKIYYTSTNITGTAQLSRLIYRVRTLDGKSTVYSSMKSGAR